MTPQVRESLLEQRKAFIAKFGRRLRPSGTCSGIAEKGDQN